MKPIFEYDPKKSQSNFEKHGVSLADAQALWDGPYVIIPAREMASEQRKAILGKINERLHVAIFTHRSIAIRIISCHRADKRMLRIFERRLHEKEED